MYSVEENISQVTASAEANPDDTKTDQQAQLTAD
jgi:hypothetical protein